MLSTNAAFISIHIIGNTVTLGFKSLTPNLCSSLCITAFHGSFLVVRQLPVDVNVSLVMPKDVFCVGRDKNHSPLTCTYEQNIFMPKCFQSKSSHVSVAHISFTFADNGEENTMSS